MVFGQIDNVNIEQFLHLGIRNDDANGNLPKLHFGHWGNDTRGSAEILQAEWTHIAFRYELGQQSMFINGVLDASAPSAPLNSIADIIVGAAGRSGENRAFSGLLDEVVNYNTALAGNQILALAEDMPPDMLPLPNADVTPPVFFLDAIRRRGDMERV